MHKKPSKIVQLYEIPRGSIIKEDCFNDAGKKIGDTIIFHHTDGMYSYCEVQGAEAPGNIIHLSVMTPLRKVGKHYVIEWEKVSGKEATSNS